MTDWVRHEATLCASSRSVFAEFLRDHPAASLCAVGYVFELWNNSPQFDVCAETTVHRAELMAGKSDGAAEDLRWNSGNFMYPAGLYRAEELGPAWESTITDLHRLANDERFGDAVYERLVETCCSSLAELAVEGLFGDAWWQLDFNVSEVADDIVVVQQRSRGIRSRIGAGRRTRG